MSAEDELSYDEIMERTESHNAVRDPDIRVEEREQRNRTYHRAETRTCHRFFVVDRDGETVLHRGRWTTPDSHHNTYEAAQARAYGYRAGLLDAIEEIEA